MEHHPQSHEEFVPEQEVIVNVEPQMPVEEPPKRGNNYLLPVSILIAGAMISGSIIYLVGSKNNAALQADKVKMVRRPLPQACLRLAAATLSWAMRTRP